MVMFSFSQGSEGYVVGRGDACGWLPVEPTAKEDELRVEPLGPGDRLAADSTQHRWLQHVPVAVECRRF